MSHNEKKAVAYIRVSTNGQVGDSVSLDVQATSIKDWALKANVQLLDIYEDTGVSGTATRQRPALQKALKLSCEEKAVFVVHSLSRVSRSVEEIQQITDMLKEAGADIVSLSD
mgnify:CR=1 FL=1